MLGKPLEFLPSAEVQLERREAEKAAVLGGGGGKETVVTPLMEFVRQRRAAKSAPQVTSAIQQLRILIMFCPDEIP